MSHYDTIIIGADLTLTPLLKERVTCRLIIKSPCFLQRLIVIDY